MKSLKEFYSSFYKRKSLKTEKECLECLAGINAPSLSKYDQGLCEGKLSLKEIFDALNNMDIKGLTLFKYEFKLPSFADDVSYFLQDLKSIKKLLWLLKYSEQFTSLKVNYEKSEICGIDCKKGVMGAFSNITSVDIVNDTVKVLGYHHMLAAPPSDRPVSSSKFRSQA